MNSLTTYLRMYYKKQDKIMLVYRPNTKSGWRDRTLYLSEEYNPNKPYNHRSLLKNEVVVEFDDDDIATNRKNSDIVALRMKKDGFKVSKWTSGNKSTHVHTFVNIIEASTLSLLKKPIMRPYSKGLPLPDLRLASDNHLIRAEYGIHEKTGRKKTLISKCKEYGISIDIPTLVWEEYTRIMKISLSNKITYHTKDLVNHKGFSFIVDSSKFRICDDGRERALFMLIHVLKEKYKEDKEGLIKFLQDWYKYSSGTAIDDEGIRRKVVYHWNRNYKFGTTYINELLESVGRADLCE